MQLVKITPRLWFDNNAEFDMIDSADPERAARVLAAMNTMIKFDLAKLETLYNGPSN